MNFLRHPYRLLPRIRAARVALLAALLLGIAPDLFAEPPAPTSAAELELEKPTGEPADEAVEKEPPPIAAPLPEDIPMLPSPRERSIRVELTKKNAAQFRDLLLLPLDDWVQRDFLSARLVRTLDFKWTLGPEWEDGSRRNRDAFALDGRVLRAKPGSSRRGGVPFPASRIAGEKDPAVKADMILWNATAVVSAPRALLYEGELAWIGTNSVLRASKGIFYRRYYFETAASSAQAAADEASSKPEPAQGASAQASSTQAPSAEAPSAEAPSVSGSSDGAKQSPETSTAKTAAAGAAATLFGDDGLLFKEVLQLTLPPVVSGFAHLTWRYAGAQDDKVWIFSPVSGKSRRVLSANRSDPLLDGVLTMDDFFVWGADPTSFTARVVDEKVVLAPFPSVSDYLASPPEPQAAPVAADSAKVVSGVPAFKRAADTLAVRGYLRRIDGSYSTVLWSHQMLSRTVAPWVPVSAVWVPRSVWILELEPLNPYYATGREVLVVDKESQLPLYKIVYDHGGEYQRTVVAGWGLARSTKGARRFPFVSFLVAVGPAARQATTFSTDAVYTAFDVESESTKALDRLFDIEAHGEAPSKEAGKGRGAVASGADSAKRPATKQPPVAQPERAPAQPVPSKPEAGEPSAGSAPAAPAPPPRPGSAESDF